MKDNEYTTLRIKKTTKDKLNQLKDGKIINYNDLIERLMEGVINDDVLEIDANRTAFTLQYISPEKTIVKDVTFKDLKYCKLGDSWVANPNPAGEDYTNNTAKVWYKSKFDVVVLFEVTFKEKGVVSKSRHIIHATLF